MSWLLDIRSQIDGLSGALQTPLHLAAQGGHKDMIQLLLKRKAPVTVRDRLMRNPLHYATWFCLLVERCLEEVSMSFTKASR